MHTKFFGSVEKSIIMIFWYMGGLVVTARGNFYRWLHMFWQARHVVTWIVVWKVDVTVWCNMWLMARGSGALWFALGFACGESFSSEYRSELYSPLGGVLRMKSIRIIFKTGNRTVSFWAVFKLKMISNLHRSFELYYKFWGAKQALMIWREYSRSTVFDNSEIV